ncbi:response regulator receiver domain-containing protein [Salinisphaera sp. T5B8]
MVIEDEADKRDSLTREIDNFFDATTSEIEFSETFSDATRSLLRSTYDLIVVDLILPRRAGDEPADVSYEILEHITESGLNNNTTIVAISRFEEIVTEHSKAFARAGIFLISYGDESHWKACLNICMQKVCFSNTYKFVIICALELERSAYRAVNDQSFEYGELTSFSGLDIREMQLAGVRGACVVLPRMGIVDSSIVSTRILEVLKPDIVCMSGICGGFPDEVEVGTLLVSDVCWEHQAGKWRGDSFQVRSFQEPLNNEVRVIIHQILENDPNFRLLESKYGQINVPHVGGKIAPTVSGSAVIASEIYQQQIRRQHGNVAGIDMEIFGLHRAVSLSQTKPICFAVKTVVDMADEQKNDDIHDGGAILAARFTVAVLVKLLE